MDYKFKPQYVVALREHFGVVAGRIEVDEKNKRRYEANPLPTFAGFAVKIGVPQAVMTDWRKSHPEWDQACIMAQEAQEDILIQNTLRGAYNNTFASFTAKNFMGDRIGGGALRPDDVAAAEDRTPFETARRIAFILGAGESPENKDLVKNIKTDIMPEETTAAAGDDT